MGVGRSRSRQRGIAFIDGLSSRRRFRQGANGSSDGPRQLTEAAMRKLLVLLVALTMGCGVAAGVTINHASAFVDDATQRILVVRI